MPRLLIVDDDARLFALLEEYLGKAGYSCFHAPDGGAGLAAIAAESWDLVILDVMLPGLDGHEVLRRVRAEPATAALPVLMLSARGGEDDKVLGLELGADDYLAKPFGPKELLARLRALLRRTRQLERAGDDTLLLLDDMVVEKDSMTVTAGGSRLEITPSELRLLELFAENPGAAISRAELHEKITGRPLFVQDRSLDMMISRLRKKLGPRRDGGERIRAARNEGYMFLLSGGRE